MHSIKQGSFFKLQKNIIDYEQSFMLGDRDTDIEFGKNMGVCSFGMQTNEPFPRLGFQKRTTNEKINIATNRILLI